jgi:hypothetical protein
MVLFPVLITLLFINVFISLGHKDSILMIFFLIRIVVGGVHTEDWQGKPKYSEKTFPSAILSTTDPTCQTRARTLAAAMGSQRLTA